ncbi:hypothetical protein MF672_008090 [Actinomadura sp. ATCC 31491]|uniref:OmpR/PhoB-type domain-containing protein n=1 Tax=Actinomadura luzonensis TaxID=2805427 RepID=A0ABT0FN23_9ACTN|nr:BTAD domain-containing putative transcriptional regulator [Actinomadura luzonensis]MCK2213746.1 hypothetical protein [Actinomadura luzonensis]
MQVQLLGPVCLRGRTGPVRSVPGRARSLLAALAWQPAEFVPDEVLIERIWGEATPRDPRDALYTAAKRLRRTAAEVSRDPLVRRRGGYVLEAEPQRVDLYRFRALVGAAREADDDVRRSRLYAQALRLWTGPPLADLAGRWAGGAREALAFERLAARIATIETSLRLGRPAEVAPLLVGLMSENPLNERLAALLMLALYLSGRGPWRPGSPPPSRSS